MSPRTKRKLVEADRVLNWLLAGSLEETVSTRAARARAHYIRWGCVVCSILDFFDWGHCDRELKHAERCETDAGTGEKYSK